MTKLELLGNARTARKDLSDAKLKLIREALQHMKEQGRVRPTTKQAYDLSKMPKTLGYPQGVDPASVRDMVDELWGSLEKAAPALPVTPTCPVETSIMPELRTRLAAIEQRLEAVEANVADVKKLWE